MKVTIGAGFFTEWDVDVDSGHEAKIDDFYEPLTGLVNSH